MLSTDVISTHRTEIRTNLVGLRAQVLKRALDLAAASILALLVAPLMGLIALYLKLFERGPVLFAHTRVGRHGELFACYKFRTMVTNSAQVLAELLATDEGARLEWARGRKLRNDPRVSPIGRLLRQTSLDELPQLLNVLKGQMSIVGPRPVVPDELELYGDNRVYYLQVRPGITGLWQVSGRNDLDYAQRVALDAQYVREWSIRGDLSILLATLRVVVARKGVY